MTRTFNINRAQILEKESWRIFSWTGYFEYLFESAEIQNRGVLLLNTLHISSWYAFFTADLIHSNIVIVLNNLFDYEGVRDFMENF